jgi:hypothetical protein
MDGHVVTGGTEQYSNERGLALVLPFADGSVRIITIDRAYQEGCNNVTLVSPSCRNPPVPSWNSR